MAQPPEWLYCLTDEQGRSYYVDNGIVQQPVSTPMPLPVTPDGWQGKTIKYGRNTRYWSVFRTFTTPLKYVKQAALIVRDRWIRSGSEDKLYQVIHRLDKSFLGGWKHKFFYKGQLDLSKVKDSDNNIAVNIMEGGLSKFINANENTEYELDINVPDAVDIKHDGLELSKQGAFSLVQDFEIKKSDTSTNIFLPVIFINEEGKASGITFSDQEIQSVGGLSFNDKINQTNTLADTSADTSPIVCEIVGTIKFECTVNSVPLGFRARFLTSGLTIPTQDAYQIFGLIPVAGSSYTFNISTTITMQPNEKLHLEGIFFGGITGSIDIGIRFLEGTEFFIKFKNRYKTTFIKGLRPAYVAQKLIDKMTGGGYAFNSTLLSTEWENLLLTSGDAIRGFADAKLKISWADFYDSYNVPCNLSSGIRSQASYIEKKENAFQANILQDLGRVSKMDPESATEFQYNVVKIGYPDSNTEDVNGRDEFNVTVVYTSPITSNNKTLDLVSKIIASMYEIELTRINLDGKTTTDDENDSRSFFLHVEKTATAGTGDEPAIYYKLLRPVYDSVTGLISPSTAFNMELHPELCLRRHGNFLRSVFYWQDSKDLVRETSKKNDKVVVIKAGQTYIGNKNIRISTLDPALFIPIIFKVEGPMPMSIIDTMDAGPDGTFSFLYGDDTYYGFPMEVGIQPATRATQETTLLCSPQTNINQLITMKR